MPLLSSKSLQRLLLQRTLLVGMGQVGLFSILAGRLYQLQIVQNDQYRLMAEDNRISVRLLAPPRGRILSRSGFIIADSIPHYQISLDTVALKLHKKTIGDSLKQLMGVIDLSEEELDRIDIALTQKQNERVFPLIEHIDWERFSRVAQNLYALDGIELSVGTSRAYIEPPIFCHLTGHIGPPKIADRKRAIREEEEELLRLADFKLGQDGLEKKYDLDLRGTVGSVQLEVNSKSQVVRELTRVDPLRGRDIVLTIDESLQRFATQRMGEESGSIVVLDIETGEVLALVSTPGYDPSRFTRGISHTDWNALRNNNRFPLTNKAISGVYPPGSTFKMVTALAALKAAVIDEHTTVYCPGYYEYAGSRFHCWKKGGHGSVNLKDSLKRSCDTFYYDIGMKTGIDAISAMARSLGLGDITHIPLPNEKKGNIPTKEWVRKIGHRDWLPGDTVITSIGQGSVLTTPLQLANMIGQILKGGNMPPIRLVTSPTEDSALLDTHAHNSTFIKPEHIALIRSGMEAVVNEQGGTAYGVRILEEGLQMGGKTGTAQVRRISTFERKFGVRENDKLPWHLRDHALFVAYAPTSSPKYALAVVVEHGGSGSKTAGPIARDVLKFTLDRTGRQMRESNVPPPPSQPSDSTDGGEE